MTSKSPQSERLAQAEFERLLELEHVLETHITHAIEVGRALEEISQSRLYRDRYANFEAYCRDRWGISSRHAERLMAAAKVERNLSLGTLRPDLLTSEESATLLAADDDADADADSKRASEIAKSAAMTEEEIDPPPLPRPANEAQYREIAKVPPERQKEVWRKAVETAPEGKVTAKHVALVAKHSDPDRRVSGHPPEQIKSIIRRIEQLAETWDRDIGVGSVYRWCAELARQLRVAAAALDEQAQRAKKRVEDYGKGENE